VNNKNEVLGSSPYVGCIYVCGPHLMPLLSQCSIVYVAHFTMDTILIMKGSSRGFLGDVFSKEKISITHLKNEMIE
jgi:hypothetical protein